MSDINIKSSTPNDPKDATTSENNKYIHVRLSSSNQPTHLTLKDDTKFFQAAPEHPKKIGENPKNTEAAFFWGGGKIDGDSYNKSLTELNITNGSNIELRFPCYMGPCISILNIFDKMNDLKNLNVIFEGKVCGSFGLPFKDNTMFAEVVFKVFQILDLNRNKIQLNDITFLFKGEILKSYSHKTLKELGVKSGDTILIIDSADNDSLSSDINNQKDNPLFISKDISLKEKDVSSNSSFKDEKNEKESLENKDEEEKNERKKLDLNIIYFDENLKNEENNDYCTFFDMNINGTFYGCHYFELFKIICEKIKNKNKEFILISSGSCLQKVFDYCKKMKEIREYFIFCFKK